MTKPLSLTPPPEFVFGGELSTPVRLAYGLVPLFQLVESRGLSGEIALASAEIPRFALEEPSYRISLAQELTFTRTALEQLGGNVALEVGGRFHLSMFGLLGLAAACASTLRESFHLFLSYPALVWGMIEIVLWREPTREYVAFTPGEVAGDLGDYFVARDMAALLILFRNILGAQIAPTSITLQKPMPDSTAAYTDFFGCDVSFGHIENTMHFAPSTWNSRPPQANEMSRRFFEQQCRTLNESIADRFSYADTVRSHLRHATPIPSLPEMANELHLTTRTLQRRLASEGSSFAKLLREVRMSRVLNLLRHRELPVEEIGYRLGFHDPDAFTRAFRQWYGIPPTEYRREGLPLG